jgi:hypothetical protein
LKLRGEYGVSLRKYLCFQRWYGSYSSQISAACEMANTPILAGVIFLMMLSGYPIMVDHNLVMVVDSRKMMLGLPAQLLSHSRAVTCHCFHGNRGRQRTAAEQWQPNGQQYRNEFSE